MVSRTCKATTQPESSRQTFRTASLTRKKHTKLLHTCPQLTLLGVLCDGSHQHEPWGKLPSGKWATASECAYPAKLCASMAHAFITQLLALGAVPSAQCLSMDHLKLARAAHLFPRMSIASLDSPSCHRVLVAFATPGCVGNQGIANATLRRWKWRRLCVIALSFDPLVRRAMPVSRAWTKTKSVCFSHLSFVFMPSFSEECLEGDRHVNLEL